MQDISVVLERLENDETDRTSTHKFAASAWPEVLDTERDFAGEKLMLHWSPLWDYARWDESCAIESVEQAQNNFIASSDK
jgi:hypothetical protein